MIHSGCATVVDTAGWIVLYTFLGLGLVVYCVLRVLVVAVSGSSTNTEITQWKRRVFYLRFGGRWSLKVVDFVTDLLLTSSMLSFVASPLADCDVLNYLWIPKFTYNSGGVVYADPQYYETFADWMQDLILRFPESEDEETAHYQETVCSTEWLRFGVGRSGAFSFFCLNV